MNVNVTVDTHEQSQVLVALGRALNNYKEKKMAEPIGRCLWKPFVLHLLLKKNCLFTVSFITMCCDFIEKSIQSM